jgi:guanylate kinase
VGLRFDKIDVKRQTVEIGSQDLMTSQRRSGLIFVLVGPPGAGKNVLMNNVLERLTDLKQLPTATTRPMRPTEQQGREHLFVTHAEFQQMDDSNALIESQEIHGEQYGMPKSTVNNAIDLGQDIIADIDVLGATYLRSIYPDNAILIFIQPPSIEDLKARMQTRGETEAEIEKRMRRVTMEMQYAPLCDYLITNETGKIEQSSEMLYGIIVAERSHRALLNLRVDRQLPRHKFTYVATVVPVFEEYVLCKEQEPHLPTLQLSHGEYPHEAALRSLANGFDMPPEAKHLYQVPHHVTASDEQFIAPVSVSSIEKEHHHEITFHYVYQLPARLNPPQGWNYTPLRSLQLPNAIQKVIETFSNYAAFEPKEVIS